jgi:hypothetical protein
MRRFVIASALALVAALPGAARADILVTPYYGVNFGGSTVDKRSNIGASVGWLGSRGLGLEVDLGFVPDFFKPKDLELDVFGKNNVTTLMGNVVFGRAGGGFQPYVSAGGGLIRSKLGSFGELFDEVATNNGFGVDAGAGLRVGGRRLGVRGDVRYFRNLTGTDDPLTEDVLGDFSFWRATVGLSIGF